MTNPPTTTHNAFVSPEPPKPILLRPLPVKKASLPPPNPLPSSLPVSPSPPQQALSDHLYRALKTGVCADVRIWVRRWNVGWLVHKMVLVQAGFFQSLFMGGFSEDAPPRPRTKSQHVDGDDEWSGEDIELTFDDPNITRTAFEICLSRLYSPFPQFHFPVSMLPTAAQPLTPSYPPGASFPSLQMSYDQVAANMHLVTPRLCLSLLATATYLGQPYLLREVLAIVLRTVGPSTVGRYLEFAIGDGIGDEEWDNQDDEGAKGMEKVARTLSSGFTQHDSDEWVSEIESEDISAAPDRSPRQSLVESPLSEIETSPPEITHRTSTDSALSDEYAKVSDHSVSRTSSMKSNATARPLCSEKIVRVDDAHARPTPSMPQYYGFVSNKIGEACVCWLARWGLDILNIETQLGAEDKDVPIVWGHGGIPAKFVRAILSSDALFVPNERERYQMTRRVLELRRESWQDASDEMSTPMDATGPIDEDAWEDEENEIAKVFAEGIYYSHMSFEDLSVISSDIDLATALPYAPLHILQAAHWQAADFKSRISGAKNADNEGELGFTQTTSEISGLFQRRKVGRSRLSTPYGSSLPSKSTLSFSSLSLNPGLGNPVAPDATFFPVPSDDTHRIGATGLLFVSTQSVTAPLPSIPGMPDFGPEWGEAISRQKPPSRPHDERSFFGIMRGARRGPEIDAKLREEGGILPPGMVDRAADERWSKVEPFRFAVEFWGVDKLNVDSKERLYSQTYFYAGSYFNVYVSAIRKKDKGVQLGIYLHRQSTTEPFPTASSPNSPPSSRVVTEAQAQSQDAAPTLAPNNTPNNSDFTRINPGAGANMYRTFSVSPPVIGSPVSRHNSLPDASSDEARENPYVDPRDITKAYFSITCATALGTAMVRFSSAPDCFALSQSWGWKSSALRSEEYLSVPSSEGDSALGWVGESGEGGSLRATVVVGII
ncbi:hypothetical protein CcaverHIS002_0404500 [Cutaneotrichosporon cavernicola]|uniref:BTB domain-containing protein n=1 Tax=Cutaneotrichosporon cavernicola TaxID=279322 RepID=A0AA48L469_9TREE|nr:uncharacterized protein CcaverHIS019_0404470 [Cutaneotrichosporon cavernicola]BEI83846.1 hypothetical protein CcaverHIS002_0404500 [Cutaneotrichosporon cavernicola]BEI91627.1 hypothetical protein CcaverHIS019_0404470 [Cutaneotrichosporon cavernicola]BEI99403.1 hypothetical protein CcaverHIS631_0404460 [Cutaneotrichosporon cavernicola]